jgi:uncharacterized membrane protein
MNDRRRLSDMPRRDLAILLLLLLLAAAVRLLVLDHPAYWEDEIITVTDLLVFPEENGEFRQVDRHWILSQPWQPTWAAYHQVLFETEDSPYLYFDLIRLWSRWFGLEEHAIRSLSALLSLAGVTVLALLAWRLIPGRGWLAVTALGALHPYLVELGRDARPYAPTLLLTPLSLLLLWRIARGGARWWHHAAWTAVLTALLYTHYFNAFFVGAQLLVLLVVWRRPAAWLHGLASAILFAPGLWILYSRLLLIRGDGRPIWIQAGESGGLMDWFGYALTLPKKLVAGSTFPYGQPHIPALVVVAGLAAAALLILGARSLYRRSSRTALSLGLLVAVPLAAVFLADQLLDLYSIRSPRYMIYVFFPLFLLAAAPAGERTLRRWQAGLAIVVTAGLVLGLVHYFREPRLLMDWRAQAHEIAAATGSEGLVVTDNPRSGFALAWYFPGPRRLAFDPDLATLRRELAGRSGGVLAYQPRHFRPDSLTELPPTRLDPLVREGLLRVERVTFPPNRYRFIIYFRIQNGAHPGTQDSN